MTFQKAAAFGNTGQPSSLRTQGPITTALNLRKLERQLGLAAGTCGYAADLPDVSGFLRPSNRLDDVAQEIPCPTG